MKLKAILAIGLAVSLSGCIFDETRSNICKEYTDEVIPEIVELRSDGFTAQQIAFEVALNPNVNDATDLIIMIDQVYQAPHFTKSIEQAVFYGKCVAGML